MTVTRFEPGRELIRVSATIWAADGRSRLIDLALDTGAAATLIIPEVTDALGYGAHVTTPRRGAADQRKVLAMVMSSVLAATDLPKASCSAADSSNS